MGFGCFNHPLFITDQCNLNSRFAESYFILQSGISFHLWKIVDSGGRNKPFRSCRLSQVHYQTALKLRRAGVDHRQRIGQGDAPNLAVFGDLQERVLRPVRVAFGNLVNVADDEYDQFVGL